MRGCMCGAGKTKVSFENREAAARVSQHRRVSVNFGNIRLARVRVGLLHSLRFARD